MVHKIQNRKKYPSDLTDEQGTILGPMIPPAKKSKRGGRPRTVDTDSWTHFLL
jgi:transposase